MHRRTCLQSNRLTHHCYTSVWLCHHPNLLHKHTKSGQRVNSFEPKLLCSEEGAVTVCVCVCTSMWVSRLPVRSGVICCLQPLKLTSKDCSRRNAALIPSSQFAKLSFNIPCLIKTTRNSVWILIVCLCCVPAAGQFQKKKKLIRMQRSTQEEDE